MMALSVALVGETVAKERAGSAMGLLGTMSAIGTTLGPSFGGFLIAGFGWRTIFLVNLPLGLLNFLLARRWLPLDRRESNAARVRFDPAGTSFFAIALVAYALAMTVGGGHFGSLNIALLSAAMCGVGLFVRAEMRTTSPLVHPAMLRDSSLTVGLGASALVATVMREAPSRTLLEQLWAVGAGVRAYDPEAADETARIYGSRKDLVLCDQYAALEGADALVIVTEWKAFRSPDFERIRSTLKHAVVFDGRNIYEPKAVEAAGLAYYGIGRGRSIVQ